MAAAYKTPVTEACVYCDAGTGVGDFSQCWIGTFMQNGADTNLYFSVSRKFWIPHFVFISG